MANGRQVTGERADDYRTKRALATRFSRHRSGRLLVGGAAAAAAVRVALAATAIDPWGWSDLVAVGIGLALVGVVEWFAHRVLFHAPEGSRRARILNTGSSHRRHHRDPLDLGWVVLAPRGARALMVAVAVLVVAWAAPIAAISSTSPLGPYLSALTVGWAAIANYEWTHLLIHSSYRPRTGYYRRLARNHRLHHHRNERYWYGVTTNLGDRVFGTLPPTADAVPLSDSTRTL